MKIFRILSLFCCIALALACAKEDSQETGYKYEAVFIGDSITANWRNPEKGGHPEFFTSNNFLAMGYSGKTTAGLMKLFKASVINENPRQVVILAGINDVAQNDGEYVSNEKIVENLAWMANEATKNGIRVVLCSVTPSSAFWWSSVSHPEKIIIELNKLIKALAEEKGYDLLVMMFSNIMAEGSMFVCAGPKKDVVMGIIETQIDEMTGFDSEIISRKQQLMPKISEAIDAL